jgi:protein TonB
MASMSGAVSPAIPPAPPRPPRRDDDDVELFTGLVVSNPPKIKRGLWMPASFVGHALIITALVAIPLLWPSPTPDHPDYIRALLYNPPPPPPPPLPKGSAMVQKTEPAKPVTPDPQREEPKLTAQVEVPKEEPLKPEAREAQDEQAGSPTGSDMGVAEGMEEGVEGGVVGGVPGGVIGGVVGGTGDGPVLDYDQPPRPIKITRPQYPQEAFVKKVEGVVELEILIDINGRVVSARVLRSIPQLDAAAVATVKQWVFSPAIKNGRPVATIARAPVQFRIY